MMDYNNDDDDDWAAFATPDRRLKLTIHRDQHAAAVAAVNATQVAIHRDILTILLEERDEFPVRTRIKIDVVAEGFLQEYDAYTGDDDVDVGDDDDDDDGVGAIAASGDAGGDVADVANHNNRSGIRIRLVSILDGYEQCPRHTTRDTINTLTVLCLRQVKDDTHDMLCDQNIGANYRGLDSTRDTVKEVKAILRIFPGVVSKQTKRVWVRGDDAVGGRWVVSHGGTNLPIQCLFWVVGDAGYQCNFKASPFIAVLAQVAIKFGSFEKNERGGLLRRFNNSATPLNDLVNHPFSVYSEQLIRLKEMNLFKKEDVRGQGLLLYWQNYKEHKFNEDRFRWLVEWDPTSLLQTCTPFGDQPLHLAARNSTIQAFRFVFEFYIRYYPQKWGIHLLFLKNNQQETAFELACKKHPLQHDELRSIVEDTLDNSDQPLHIVDALVTASIDERIHLDCVYTLFRRHPVTVVNALLLGPPNNNNDNNNNNNNNAVESNYRKRKSET